MRKFTVIFYEKQNGEVPVKNFLDSMDIKMKVKMVGLMEILQEKGNLLREPYSKHLQDGIFELRVKVGNDICRVLYFFYYDGRIIFTNGFIKKTRKTPKEDIVKAKKYRRDYIERVGDEYDFR